MALVALVALAVTAEAAAEGITLRLERTLSEAPPGPMGEGTEALLRFASSGIERRIDLTRERIARLERTNRELSNAIITGGDLLAALRDLTVLQEQTHATLSGAVTDAGTAPAAARTRVAASGAGATRPVAAEAPEPARSEPAAAQTPAAVQAAPAAAPARTTRPEPAAAPPRLGEPATGGGSLLSGLPGWVPIAVAGSLALVLLGGIAAWFLHRRTRSSASAGSAVAAPLRDEPRPRGVASAAPAATLDLDLEPGTGALDLDPTPGATTPAAPAPGKVAAQRPAADSDERWSNTLISRKAADPQALKEVDTLIAFEQYDKAKAVLDEMLVTDPDNPELVLRHYHVRTQGGVETTDDDEALLRAMMDGPLSDTMHRVRELGRGLMPGDPLFKDPATAAAASQALKVSKRGEGDDVPAAQDADVPAAQDADTPADDGNVVPFAATVKLARSPMRD